MNSLLCPWPVLRRLLRALAAGGGGPVSAPVGLREAAGDREWLLRDLLVPPTGPAPPESPSGREATLRISPTRDAPREVCARELAGAWPPGEIGRLYLGVGERRGEAFGVARSGSGLEPLDRLFLIGQGMHEVPLTGRELDHGHDGLDGRIPSDPVLDPTSEASRLKREVHEEPAECQTGSAGRETDFAEAVAADPAGPPVADQGDGSGALTHTGDGRSGRDAPARERLSRTIGALGGEVVWRRLVGLSVAVVGCGRTGSVVADSLSRLGFRRLALIDPDTVEPHNLGEMDLLSEADVGTPKVIALSRALAREDAPFPLTASAVTASATDPAGLEAAKDSAVLFCCADNDAARLASALLAALYHKVLIDVGTGVLNRPEPRPAAPDAGERLAAAPRMGPAPPAPVRGPAPGFPPRRIGADVRLILPGDACLLCLGNLTDYGRAVEALCSREPPPDTPEGWRSRRAGSLRSLNQIAAGLAVHLLQDLVAGRVGESRWLHLEFDEAGRARLEETAASPRPASRPCALCARSGLGDGGFLPRAGGAA